MKHSLKPIIALAALTSLLACLPVFGADITVEGNTDAAVQSAVDRSAPGDSIYLPPGKYLFRKTVKVKKSLTIYGSGELTGVGVVETGKNIPPKWTGETTLILAKTNEFDMFAVQSDSVTFKNLKIQGKVKYGSGTGDAIYCRRYNYLLVTGCELLNNNYGVHLSESSSNRFERSYIHHNRRKGLGYGICFGGDASNAGGSGGTVESCEFTMNRHDIASNGTATRFIVEKNYFHDNDRRSGQAAIDTHAQGGASLWCAVRDNTFKNTRPIAVRTGSMEITGNTFLAGCGNTRAQRHMIQLGIPEHNGVFVPQARLHGIVIANNINRSGRPLVQILNYRYPDGVVRPVGEIKELCD